MISKATIHRTFEKCQQESTSHRYLRVYQANFSKVSPVIIFYRLFSGDVTFEKRHQESISLRVLRVYQENFSKVSPVVILHRLFGGDLTFQKFEF